MKIISRIKEDAKEVFGATNVKELTEQERLRLGKQFAKDAKILGVLGGLTLLLYIIPAALDGEWGNAIAVGSMGLVFGGTIWYLSRPI